MTCCIWTETPGWTSWRAGLEKISTNPQLRIVYPPQIRVKRPGEKGAGSIAVEKSYSPRVPAENERLINALKKTPWFAANCYVVYNDTRPYATREIARLSLGDEYEPGKQYEIAGSWDIDNDTGRRRMTIFRAGFNRVQTLAEEIYHAVFDIIRSTDPWLTEKIQHLARRYAPSKPADEVFARAMASEMVSPGSSSLPGNIVGLAADIVEGRRSIAANVMEWIVRVRGSAASYRVQPARKRRA